jgi:hypothetical protein
LIQGEPKFPASEEGAVALGNAGLQYVLLKSLLNQNLDRIQNNNDDKGCLDDAVQVQVDL